MAILTSLFFSGVFFTPELHAGDKREKIKSFDPENTLGSKKLGIYHRFGHKAGPNPIAEAQLALSVLGNRINLFHVKGGFNQEIGPHGLIKLGQPPFRPFYKSVVGQVKIGVDGYLGYKKVLPSPIIATPFPVWGAAEPFISPKGGLALSYTKPHVYPWGDLSLGTDVKAITGVPDAGKQAKLSLFVEGDKGGNLLDPNLNKKASVSKNVHDVNFKVQADLFKMADIGDTEKTPDDEKDSGDAESSEGNSDQETDGDSDGSDEDQKKNLSDKLKDKLTSMEANAGIKGKFSLDFTLDYGKVEKCPGGKAQYVQFKGVTLTVQVFAKVAVGPVDVSANIDVPPFPYTPSFSVGKKHPLWWCGDRGADSPNQPSDSYDKTDLLMDPIVYKDVTASVTEQGDFLLPGNQKRLKPSGDVSGPKMHKFLTRGESQQFPFLPQDQIKKYRSTSVQKKRKYRHFKKPRTSYSERSLAEILKTGIKRETLWPRINGNSLSNPHPEDGTGPVGIWEENSGKTDQFPYVIASNWTEDRDHMKWKLRNLRARADYKWLVEVSCGEDCTKWVPRYGTGTSNKNHYSNGRLDQNISSFFHKAKQKIKSNDPEEHSMGLFLLGRGAHYIIDSTIPMQTMLVPQYTWKKEDQINLGKVHNPPPNLTEKANNLYRKNKQKIRKKAIAEHYGVDTYADARNGLKKYVNWVSRQLKSNPTEFLSSAELESEYASGGNRRNPDILSEIMQSVNKNAPISLNGGNWKEVTRTRFQLIGKYLATLFEWAAPGYFDYGRNDVDKASLRKFGPVNSTQK